MISGIAKYECYVNGTKKGESETNTIKVNGLDQNTTYDNITIKVIDNAGNISESLQVSCATKMSAGTPVITVLNNNTWAREKTAQIQGIDGYAIRYTLDGTNPSATTGIQLTGTGTENITMDRENCRVRAVYINNKTNKVTNVGVSEEGRIDRTGPTISLNINSGETEVNASWSGADSKSGMHSTAYRYKLDYEGSYSEWTGSTSVIKTGVVNGKSGRSGTFYVEARDNLGNTSTFSNNYATSGVKSSLPNLSGIDKITIEKTDNFVASTWITDNRYTVPIRKVRLGQMSFSKSAEVILYWWAFTDMVPRGLFLATADPELVITTLGR